MARWCQPVIRTGSGNDPYQIVGHHDVVSRVIGLYKHDKIPATPLHGRQHIPMYLGDSRRLCRVQSWHQKTSSPFCLQRCVTVLSHVRLPPDGGFPFFRLKRCVRAFSHVRSPVDGGRINVPGELLPGCVAAEVVSSQPRVKVKAPDACCIRLSLRVRRETEILKNNKRVNNHC